MKNKAILSVIGLLGMALTLSPWARSQQAQPEVNPGKALVMEAIEAHGGIETWRNSGALHFRWKYNMTDKGVVIDSVQTIDPISFEALHTVPDSSTRFGRNAEGQYWVSPPDASFKAPIPFWTLTPIYFVGIPFVFDDDKITYKLLPQKKEFQSKDYAQVQITYSADAGESPDDLYVLLIDKDTKRVKGAYYTVTSPLVYKGGPLVKKFITLDNLQDVNGLLLAGGHVTYSMTDGVIGEAMRSTEVSEVRFIDRKKVNFAIPSDAKIYE